MMQRLGIITLCALGAICSAAQAHDGTEKLIPVSERATNLVRVETLVGDFFIELYGAVGDSPAHVANFLQYVNAKDFDQSIFHRTVQPGGTFSVIQGGGFRLTGDSESLDPAAVDAIESRGSVPNEFKASNGLTNRRTTIGAARSNDPNSANSQWYVNTTDNTGVFGPGPFTVFGAVTHGMDVVDRISRMIHASPSLFEDTQFNGAFNQLPRTADGRFAVVRSISQIAIMEGDFDDDGDVDEDDFATWLLGFGTSGGALPSNGDADRDGDIDGDDFLIWQANFIRTAGTAAGGGGSGSFLGIRSDSLAAAGVPEPASLALCVVALAAAVAFVRRFR